MIKLSSNSLQYIFLIASTLLIGFLLIILIKIKKKSQMHYILVSLITLLIIWNLGVGSDKLWSDIYGYSNMFFVFIIFIGTCFTPVSLLLTGIIFAKTKINFKFKYILLLAIPITSTLVLWTNNYHHLFFIKYSFTSNNVIYGRYFLIHAVYSYICILLGMYYLLYFSVKNTGIFSKQSVLILTGSCIPLIVNILFTLKIFEITLFATPIAFSIAIIFFFAAIIKYDFLGVLPIAIQTAVDRISDGFIIIDLEYRIVNYNKTLMAMFNGIVEVKRKDDIFSMLKAFKAIDVKKLKSYIEEVVKTRKSIVFEQYIKVLNVDKYFDIEITPIIEGENHLGTIILLNDITEHKANLKKINEQQEQIIEKERLASLGTLMGGISHNLKTPIMSISGCIIALEDLTKEYYESVGNSIVSEDDHREIANEMSINLKDIKEHFSYMSKALTAIKNQVASSDSRKEISFTQDEILQNIEFLMKYEIKSNFCNLIISNEIQNNFLINGDIGTLVQIINNLISNSIQSYGKITDTTNIDVSSRKIELIIYEIDNYIVFKVKDYGRGVPQRIKDKLFKEMVTTKGKEGSGIGLYLSYSKVKVMFNGDMWLESEEEKGSSFYVKVKKFLL
ncbi:MAG: hypothetical protein H7Y18_19690 [Clostridiaceae bacterium]|nr:hypothetical protein [Clostridiaceae bacterium]